MEEEKEENEEEEKEENEEEEKEEKEEEENDEDDEEKIQKRYSNVSHESYPNNCVSWSVKNLNIAIALVSWLRLHFLSNMISQTLNNEVLAETVSLKNSFVRTVSDKN